MSERQGSNAVVRLRGRTLAVLFAVVGGVALFGATAILLVRGGRDVGQHLQLLRHYLPGYRVTWTGAFLGLAYGAALGALLGGLLASVYNAVASRRERARCRA